MVAGVKGVTIIHGCSCAGGEVYLLRRQRCRAVVSGLAPRWAAKQPNNGKRRYFRQNAVGDLGPLRSPARGKPAHHRAMAPMNAFLLLQSLQTLALRMERHTANALKIDHFKLTANLQAPGEHRRSQIPGLPSGVHHPTLRPARRPGPDG
ncbi:PLP-dependent transferase [Pseudomonas sp. Bout1]|uniref:PLP-dependent transferase n=1 Tax=Pseudomonas sp. Bout1 TaxID=3048600 RepID=UPI0039FB9A3A